MSIKQAMKCFDLCKVWMNHYCEPKVIDELGEDLCARKFDYWWKRAEKYRIVTFNEVDGVDPALIAAFNAELNAELAKELTKYE